MNIKHVLKDNPEFKKESFHLYYPVIAISLVLLIFFSILSVTLTRDMNTIYYMDATVENGTVYSFSNNNQNMLLIINDKLYETNLESLPNHVQDGDAVRVAVDSMGHILNNENYKVGEQLYVNGVPYFTDERQKVMEYDEYKELLGVDSRVNLGVLLTCHMLFTFISGVVLIFFSFTYYRKFRKISQSTPLETNI